MKKILLMLVVVGVLITGMFSVVEEMCDNISFEDMEISEENPEESWGDVVPCGGSAGGGGGGVPG